jgi:hypothetical protein
MREVADETLTKTFLRSLRKKSLVSSSLFHPTHRLFHGSFESVMFSRSLAHENQVAPPGGLRLIAGMSGNPPPRELRKDKPYSWPFKIAFWVVYPLCAYAWWSVRLTQYWGWIWEPVGLLAALVASFMPAIFAGCLAHVIFVREKPSPGRPPSRRP